MQLTVNYPQKWDQMYQRSGFSKRVNHEINKSSKLINNYYFDEYYELKTECVITYDFDNNFNHVIKIEYATEWIKKWQEVSMGRKKCLNHNTSIEIFDLLNHEFLYNKDKKAQTVAKIKRYMDKVMKKAIEKYFIDENLTINRPKSHNFLKSEERYIKEIKELIQ